MVLRKLHFPVTKEDVKTLRKRFLRNVNEPGHVRTQAAFMLGVIETNRGNNEDAVEMYRNLLLSAPRQFNLIPAWFLWVTWWTKICGAFAAT